MSSASYLYSLTENTVCKLPQRVGLATLRRYLSFFLIGLLLMLSVPAPVKAVIVQEGIDRSSELATRTESTTRGVLERLDSFLRGGRKTGQNRGMPQEPANLPGVRPEAPSTKAERASRVASIRSNMRNAVVLRSREPMLFSGVPVDSAGETIQGLKVEWESSNHQVIFIRKNGEALAGKPGAAVLTAKAGQAIHTVAVTVIEGSREEFGGKKRENSTRRSQQRTQVAPAHSENANVGEESGRKRHHARTKAERSSSGTLKTSTTATMQIRPPNEDPLPDDETGSLYEPAYCVGSPPGKTRRGATTPPSTLEANESGNKNFTFRLPVVGLPGRGIDVSLSLTYNSLVYHKSTTSFGTWLTYNVDSGWPAPGFRLGYGQIEDQGTNGFTLTDASGTRHALLYTSAYNYKSNDGTFLHFVGGSGWGTLFYPDGTQVTYGAAGGGYRSYPTRITDRNGNYVDISYVNGVGPRINSIKDTVERYITFHYDSNGDLVTIKAPGLTGQADRQVMRFYYENISLTTSNLFDSSINLSAPSTARVLKYVYYPSSVESSNAHIGYRFDNSIYGMIYQIKKFHGMAISSSSESSTGSVSTDGTQAAVTTYNYPTTASGLTDVPTFTERKDDWAGRTVGMNGNFSTLPAYTFAETQGSGEKILTVTGPDDSITETYTNDNPGVWNHGLVSAVKIKHGSTVLTHTQLDWSQGVTGGAYRLSQVRVTDVPASLTKATVFTYDDSNGPYNNISVVSERDLTSNGTVSSTELRRTETSYVTSSAYINRHLYRLPASVKIYPGGSSTPAARVDYA